MTSSRLLPVVARTTPGAARPPGALDLDVQLDVLGEARAREVRRADERLRADDLELRVGDVRLGVELVLRVDAALDLPDSAAPRRSPARRRGTGLAPSRPRCSRRARSSARSFVAFEERGLRVACVTSAPIRIRILSSCCHLPSSPSSDADLEEAGRDVEALRDLGPLLEVAEPVQPETLLSTMKRSPPSGAHTTSSMVTDSRVVVNILCWAKSERRTSIHSPTCPAGGLATKAHDLGPSEIRDLGDRGIAERVHSMKIRDQPLL